MQNEHLANEQTAKQLLPEIKKFLVYDCEFKNRSYHAVCKLSQIIADNKCADGDLIMKDEYAVIAGGKNKGEALRVTLSKLIKANYETVKRAVKEKFSYRLPEYFYGVKAFIDDLTIVFDLR